MAKVIWERCFDKQWCVHIPLDGDRCFGIHACIRLVEDNAAFFLELQLNGVVKRINLANACITLPVSIFQLKVCVNNVSIAAHLISFDISVDGCIDVSIGPIGIHECVNLTRQHVVIATLTEREHIEFLAPIKPSEDLLHIFYEREATPKEILELESASKSAKWQQL